MAVRESLWQVCICLQLNSAKQQNNTSIDLIDRNAWSFVREDEMIEMQNLAVKTITIDDYMTNWI